MACEHACERAYVCMVLHAERLLFRYMASANTFIRARP